MINEIKIGDKVRVMDQGLLMMQRFAPPNSKPNNEGYVKEIMDDGDLLIEFPIGDDPIEEHSQVAPYSASICKKINNE